MAVYTDSKHLVGDSVTELHSFAEQIGLSWDSFNPDRIHPHYLMDSYKARKAYHLGAIPVDNPRQILQICTRNYQIRQLPHLI